MLTFSAMIFSSTPGITFFALTAIFLLFITAQYTQLFFRKNQKTTLLIASGFAALFIGENLLALTYAFKNLFIIGYLFILTGYIFLLASLCYLKTRNNTKTAKAEKNKITKNKIKKNTKDKLKKNTKNEFKKKTKSKIKKLPK